MIMLYHLAMYALCATGILLCLIAGVIVAVYHNHTIGA